MDSTSTQSIIEQAQNISPFTPYVYGFLVMAFVSAIIFLTRWVKEKDKEAKELREQTIKENNKVIENNTKAFEKYNQRLEDEKKKKMI